MVLAISLAMLVIYIAVDAMKSLTDFVETLSDTANLSPAILTVVLKTVGIAIVTKTYPQIFAGMQGNPLWPQDWN